MNINNYNKSIKSKSIVRLAFSNWGFSWEGLFDNRNGEWLLFSQLALIMAHLLPGWPNIFSSDSFWSNLTLIPGICIFTLGLILSIKALINLGGSLSPLPEPKKNGYLIRTGSYKSCRHPLYQSILISSLGVIVAKSSLLHLFFFILLTVILKSKAKREEKRLNDIYPTYRDYMQNTPAIISWIKYLDWSE